MGVQMAGDWTLRCALSGFHVCGAVAACASLVASLVHWASNLLCLPPRPDRYGDPLKPNGALSVACDVIMYNSGVSCLLNLFMAVSVHCCWHRRWCYFQHQVLTLLMCVLSVGSGTLLTVDFILWCDSVQQNVSDFRGCRGAVRLYDSQHSSSNMTAYFKKMEIQQASQWAVVPFTLCAVVVYSVAITTRKQRGQPCHLQDNSHHGNSHHGDSHQGTRQQNSSHLDNSRQDARRLDNSYQDIRPRGGAADSYPAQSRVQDGRPRQRTGQYYILKEDESAPLILQEACTGVVRYHNRAASTSSATTHQSPGGGVHNAGASTSDSEA